MAVQIDATQPRILPGGVTAREAIEGFVSVRLDGLADLIKRLEEAAEKAETDPNRLLVKAVIQGSKPIRDSYRAKVANVTGNLRDSVRTREGKRKYDGVAIAVTGPTHRVEGKEWDVNETKGAGNHAWLIEFGTGRRKPGSQNRRAYVNVHQAINGRFGRMQRLSRTFNNEQFERLGRGYYFLMGSINEPTRRARRGSGYPHDFVPTADGGTRPFFLGSGETYGGVTAQHPMERAINDSRQAVLSAVRASLTKFIDDLSR